MHGVAVRLEFKDINTLASIAGSSTNVLPSIPRGHKDNSLFVTRLALDPRNNRATYADDCGVWKTKAGSTTITNYVAVEGRLITVTLRDGKYCTGGRKGNWIPVSPQPSPADVVKAHRHYATLQADETFRKRVTWFSNLPGAEDRAVVEYQGRHPGVNPPHGNRKYNDNPFTRTHPETLRQIDEKVKHRHPVDVYDSMSNEQSVNAPRDLQQVPLAVL